MTIATCSYNIFVNISPLIQESALTHLLDDALRSGLLDNPVAEVDIGKASMRKCVLAFVGDIVR